MSVKTITSHEAREVVRRVVRICKCGGRMENTFIEVRHPFRYKHRCVDCKAEEWLDKRYPFIEDVPPQ